MKQIPPLPQAVIESVAHVLGNTAEGLTGSQIGHLLASAGIPDVDQSSTKWKRLYNALIVEQNRRQYGNHVVALINKAMKPALYTRAEDLAGLFTARRENLNRALAFAGLMVGEDGNVRRAPRAATLDEAQERADRLKRRLRDREVHEDVLVFCRAELIERNYFHAVLEATKSVANKIRALTGLKSDGAALAQEAFSLGKAGRPLLAINPLTTETHESEQKGFTNLLVGLFGTFRNPTAHAEKIYWPIDERDALDIMSLVSLIHRKIDQATKFGVTTPPGSVATN